MVRLVNAQTVDACMNDLMGRYASLRDNPDLLSHIRGMFEAGMMSKIDAERLLLRGNMILDVGTDMTAWPTLSDSIEEARQKMQKRDPMQIARERREAAPASSHRGHGILPKPAEPDVVVLDWGLRGGEMTPPPPEPRRARTSSPVQPLRPRFGDLRSVIERQPFYKMMTEKDVTELQDTHINLTSRSISHLVMKRDRGHHSRQQCRHSSSA